MRFSPLNKANRLLSARPFKRAPRVDISLDCVIEERIGRELVDDAPLCAAFRLEIGPFIYFARDSTVPAAGRLVASIRLPTG